MGSPQTLNRAARIAVLAAVLLPASAYAAAASSPAKAIALKPLSIVKLRDLDFATAIVSPPVAGTIVINPTTDVRTVTGGVTAAGGLPQAAQFYTYGTAGMTLSVTRGPLPVLTGSAGGSMKVTQLTLNGPVLRVLTTAGLLDLRVGGTLAVGANQAPGTYSGNFQINVTYF